MNTNFKDFEEIYDMKLPRHNCTVIRLDGVGFKKATKNLTKPFDTVFSDIMRVSMEEVARTIPHCIYAYSFSDEVNFIIENKDRDIMFENGRVQKIDSIIASKFSVEFYSSFVSFLIQYNEIVESKEYSEEEKAIIDKRISSLWEFINTKPTFDCRCFSIPEMDVDEYLENRQNICITNGIWALGRKHFTHEEMMLLSSNQIRGKLFDKKDAWERYPDAFKFGIGFRHAGNSWEETTLLFGKAKTLSKKTGIKKSMEEKNHEEEK